MRRALALVLVSLFTVPIQAQQSAPAQQPANSSPASTTEQAPASGCKQPCLEDGTPVKMRISQTVSTGEKVAIGVAIGVGVIAGIAVWVGRHAHGPNV